MPTAYDRLTEKQKKLFVLRSATEGLRIKLEKSFEKEATRKLSRIYALTSKILLRNGTLVRCMRHAQKVKLMPRSKRKAVRERFLDKEFNPKKFKSLFNSEQVASLNSTYKKWVRIMYELGAVTGLRTMGFNASSKILDDISKRLDVSKAPDDIIFELTDAEIIAVLDAKEITFGAGITEGVIRDSRNMVKNNIYLGNLDVQDVGEMISSGSGIPLWRGIKIAHTETQLAFNTAAHKMYERSGVPRHTWSTVGDERVRPEHADNDGTTVKIGEEFPSGQLHPGDGPGAINCRCSVFPDLSDKNILLEPWDGGPLGVEPPPMAPKPKPKKKTPKKLPKKKKPKGGRRGTHGLDPEGFEKVGPQKGSNPGGTYVDPVTGEEWYIKYPKDPEMARNEVLSARLYEKAGVKVPEVRLVTTADGRVGVASKIEKVKVKNPASTLRAAGASEDIASDAWLANWDVVGLEYDNLALATLDDGTEIVVRLDTGGALRYRAQGMKKGAAFGDDVTELATLTNSSVNPQAANVFSDVAFDAAANTTDKIARLKRLEDSIDKVAAVKPKEIRRLVNRLGPTDAKEKEELVERLLARRKSLIEQRKKLAAERKSLETPTTKKKKTTTKKKTSKKTQKLQDELDEIQASNAAKKAELAKQEKINKEIQEAIEKAKKKQATLKKKKAAKAKDPADEYRALSKKLDDVQEDINNLENKVNQAEEDLWEAKQAGKNKETISKKMGELDSLQTSLDDLYDLSDEISDSMLGVGKKIVKKKKKKLIKTTVKRVRRAKKKIVDPKKKKFKGKKKKKTTTTDDDVAESLSDTKKKIEQQENVIQELEDDMIELENMDRADLAPGEIAQLQKKIDDAEEILDDLQFLYTRQLKDRRPQLPPDWQAKKNKAIKAKKQSVTKSKKKSKKVSKDPEDVIEAKIKENQKKMEGMADEIQELQDAIMDKNEEMGIGFLEDHPSTLKLRNKLKKLEDAYEEIRTSTVQLGIDLKDMKKKVVKKKAKKKTTSKKLSDEAPLKKELDKLAKEVDDLDNEIMDAVDDLVDMQEAGKKKSIVEAQEKKIQELEASHSKKVAQYKKVNDKVKLIDDAEGISQVTYGKTPSAPKTVEGKSYAGKVRAENKSQWKKHKNKFPEDGTNRTKVTVDGEEYRISELASKIDKDLNVESLISVEEQQAISQYSQSEYRDLNTRLRNRQPLTAQQKKMYKHLTESINRLEGNMGESTVADIILPNGKRKTIPTPKRRYRGLEFGSEAQTQDFIRDMESLIKGDNSVTINQFSSTSFDPQVAVRFAEAYGSETEVVLEIVTDKGLALGRASEFSVGSKTEAEILLNSGTKFKPIRIIEGEYVNGIQPATVVQMVVVP